MANYVDRTILCQAYIHIREVDISDESRTSFENFILDFSLARGRHFFTEECEADIKWKEGSDIYYVTLSSIGGLYLAISKYPSFRQGVTLLAKDAYRVTAGLISECLFQLDSRQYDAIRIESRAGVFMRLDNCVGKIEAAGKLIKVRGIRSIKSRIEDVEKYCVDTLYKIDDPEDREYTRSNIRELVTSNLPGELPTDRKSMKTREDVATYKALRRKLLREIDK